jgi:hypothetical protein
VVRIDANSATDRGVKVACAETARVAAFAGVGDLWRLQAVRSPVASTTKKGLGPVARLNVLACL